MNIKSLLLGAAAALACFSFAHASPGGGGGSRSIGGDQTVLGPQLALTDPWEAPAIKEIITNGDDIGFTRVASNETSIITNGDEIGFTPGGTGGLKAPGGGSGGGGIASATLGGDTGLITNGDEIGASKLASKETLIKPDGDGMKKPIPPAYSYPVDWNKIAEGWGGIVKPEGDGGLKKPVGKPNLALGGHQVLLGPQLAATKDILWPREGAGRI